MRRRTLLRLTASAMAAPAAVFAQPIVPPPTGDAPPAAPRPSDLLGASGDGYFLDWLNDFYTRALFSGVSRPLLDQALSGISPDPRVMAHDTAQPEFARPVGRLHPRLRDGGPDRPGQGIA